MATIGLDYDTLTKDAFVSIISGPKKSKYMKAHQPARKSKVADGAWEREMEAQIRQNGFRFCRAVGNRPEYSPLRQHPASNPHWQRLKDGAVPKLETAFASKSSNAVLQTAKPSSSANFRGKSERPQIMTFSMPKCLRATAAAIPAVPQPNATAFCPVTYCPRLQEITPRRGAGHRTPKTVSLSTLVPHDRNRKVYKQSLNFKKYQVY